MFSLELTIINESPQVIIGSYNSSEEHLITPKYALGSSSAVIKVQTSQTVQGEPVKCFGSNSDTTMVQCRKSLFLELLSNSAETMVRNGGYVDYLMACFQVLIVHAKYSCKP
ncbi:hypothetical protein ATANTOWER_006783 [Ataeniobius toweri]|uniref:Uncharacterized protein n=1 Tax=Ataeniobius toweri TaxID=208326 RepID=A0ABU7C6S7_9TELE|nr:hypothetical protein [Ataeniobius toweri]